MYKFREFYIPERMMEAIDRYVKHHKLPGPFLQAVISNDLKGAVGQADTENLKNLLAYIGYFHNEIVERCWGSREIMLAWCRKGGKND